MGFRRLKFIKRNELYLIKISKSESEIVRRTFPYAEIARTCIQKSKRHHYYLPEVEKYLRLIADSNLEASAICSLIDKTRKPKRNKRR